MYKAYAARPVFLTASRVGRDTDVGAFPEIACRSDAGRSKDMYVQQLSWQERAGWRGGDVKAGGADLALYFGARQALASGSRYGELRAMFPSAHVVGCSTGGQILGSEIYDDRIAALAVRFSATKVRLVGEEVAGP